MNNFNIYRQCRKIGLSLWQCPQFLFILMGLLIIITSIISYLLGTRFFADPTVVVLIVLFVTAILFIISYIITQSFEKLAEASRMKSEFINIVSHQLRAPLTNLQWGLDLITSKEVKLSPVKKEEYFSHLRENTIRMIELVDDLLVISRIEQGNLPLRKKEIFLQDIINGLVSQFKIFADASHITINFKHQNNLPLIFIDPSYIKLAVENLLDNAIRYTRGGGEIDISLGKKEKDLFFKIKDSGVGIPLDEQKFIFQKFFRAEGALKEQTRGSGLGLFITKTIIETFGGKIWFESKEGEGTTFYFTLPIK